MGWLDRLLGRGDTPKDEGAADDESRADALEEGVADQRSEDALKNPHPGVG